jgi:hypothetical protein
MERFSEWRFIISAIAKLAVAKLLAIILETAPDLAGRRDRNCYSIVAAAGIFLSPSWTGRICSFCL